jgi:hypothetical protein
MRLPSTSTGDGRPAGKLHSSSSAGMGWRRGAAGLRCWTFIQNTDRRLGKGCVQPGRGRRYGECASGLLLVTGRQHPSHRPGEAQGQRRPPTTPSKGNRRADKPAINGHRTGTERATDFFASPQSTTGQPLMRANPLISLVGVAGFELATPCTPCNFFIVSSDPEETSIFKFSRL